MTAAKEAYQLWKMSHKIDLRVYTDEQMFEVGYRSRDDEIEELRLIIETMEKDYKKLHRDITKLKRAKE